MGFTQTADRAQISGLAIANYAGAGIYAGGGDGPVLRGNLIGTDATGMLDRGNILGVGVGAGVSGGIIGGYLPHHRNVISGNVGGIICSNDYATISGNYIGTTADGSGNLGNNGSGILAQGFSSRVEQNTIRFNAARRIGVSGASSRVSIRANTVFDNGGLAIDLGNDGDAANDPDDADSGPNRLQNFPVLTRARTTLGAGMLIEGTLDRPPGATALEYQLDLYSNASCDPLGHGEGRPSSPRRRSKYLASGSSRASACGCPPSSRHPVVPSRLRRQPRLVHHQRILCLRAEYPGERNGVRQWL